MFKMHSLLRPFITLMANGGRHSFTVWTVWALSDDLLAVNEAECVVALIGNTQCTSGYGP